MQNQWLRRGLLIFGTGLILILVFGGGFFVGRWSIRAEGRSALSQVGIGGHSAMGKIVALDAQTLIVETRDGSTQTILINNQTVIERAPTRKKIAISDLQVGNRVAVVGAPNVAGQLVARIISQFPATSPGVPGEPTRAPNPSK